MVHEGKGTGGFQAHLALETNPPFRLIPHWIILRDAAGWQERYSVCSDPMIRFQHEEQRPHSRAWSDRCSTATPRYIEGLPASKLYLDDCPQVPCGAPSSNFGTGEQIPLAPQGTTT